MQTNSQEAKSIEDDSVIVLVEITSLVRSSIDSWGMTNLFEDDGVIS